MGGIEGEMTGQRRITRMTEGGKSDSHHPLTEETNIINIYTFSFRIYSCICFIKQSL